MATTNLTDYTLAADATVIDAVAMMNRNRSRTVLVVSAGKVVGLVSEGDVMRALLRGVDARALVSEVANTSFRFLTARDDAQAFTWFRAHGFGLVPIVDDDFRLVDVITLDDILERVELVDAP